jgi:hypothetical protein
VPASPGDSTSSDALHHGRVVLGLGEDGRRARLLDRVDRLLERLGTRLRLGAEGAERARHHLEPVAVSEVAERVVGGDELPIGGRDRPNVPGDLTIELVELLRVRAGTLAVVRSAARVGVGEGVPQRRQCRRDLRRVHPQVRVPVP